MASFLNTQIICNVVFTIEFAATVLALYYLYRLIVAERQSQVLYGMNIKDSSFKNGGFIKKSLLNQNVKPRIFKPHILQHV